MNKKENLSIIDKAKTVDILQTAQTFLTSEYRLHQVSASEWRCGSLTDLGNNDTCVTIHVDTNTYYDFKEKRGGDVVDFVATLKGCTQTEAAQILIGEDTGVFTPHSRRPELLKQLERLQHACETAHQNLKDYPQVINYLHSRRLSDEFIEAMKIGVAPEGLLYGNDGGEIRLWLPYFDRDGKICYLATRSLDKVGLSAENSPKYKKLWISGNSPYNLIKQPLLGLNSILKNPKDRDILTICEGVFDCYSWLQEGYSCLCFVCGDSGEDNNNIILDYAKTFNKVIFSFDNDANSDRNSGELFSLKLTRKFLDSKLNCFTIRNYGGTLKDVSDYYSAGYGLDELLKSAKSAPLHYLECFVRDNPTRADVFSLISDLRKEFWRVENVLFNPLELDILTSLIEDTYGKKVLQKVAKPATKDDLISDIASEFINKTPILATGTQSHENFFIFRNHYWQLKDRSHIDHYIEANYKLPERLYTAVSRLIFTRQKQDEEINWNEFHGFNFKNGVLDYNTGELLPHSQTQRFNFIADFDYDKNAKNELFSKWVEEVMDYDKSRIQTFRDMLGHILLADKSKSQFNFNLLGEKGSNGKSTLKEILDGIFGQFITSIPVSKLGTPTDIVGLLNSVVNFSAESSTSVNRNACASIKALTAGDRVRGNYKFRDSVEFKPRSTLIFSFNEMPKYSETSPAFKRRLIFIHFKRSFLGRENKNLVSEILKDKAGVFNYIYQCYLDLKANGFDVRPCADQKPLLKELELETDLVASFWHEYQIEKLKDSVKTTKTVNEMHKEYITWLDDTHNRTASMTQYQLTKQLKQLTGLETRQIRSGDERGKLAFDFSEIQRTLLAQEVQEIQKAQEVKAVQEVHEAITPPKEPKQDTTPPEAIAQVQEQQQTEELSPQIQKILNFINEENGNYGWIFSDIKKTISESNLTISEIATLAKGILKTVPSEYTNHVKGWNKFIKLCETA